MPAEREYEPAPAAATVELGPLLVEREPAPLPAARPAAPPIASTPPRAYQTPSQVKRWTWLDAFWKAAFPTLAAVALAATIFLVLAAVVPTDTAPAQPGAATHSWATDTQDALKPLWEGAGLLGPVPILHDVARYTLFPALELALCAAFFLGRRTLALQGQVVLGAFAVVTTLLNVDLLAKPAGPFGLVAGVAVAFLAHRTLRAESSPSALDWAVKSGRSGAQWLRERRAAADEAEAVLMQELGSALSASTAGVAKMPNGVVVAGGETPLAEISRRSFFGASKSCLVATNRRVYWRGRRFLHGRGQVSIDLRHVEAIEVTRRPNWLAWVGLVVGGLGGLGLIVPSIAHFSVMTGVGFVLVAVAVLCAFFLFLKAIVVRTSGSSAPLPSFRASETRMHAFATSVWHAKDAMHAADG